MKHGSGGRCRRKKPNEHRIYWCAQRRRRSLRWLLVLTLLAAAIDAPATTVDVSRIVLGGQAGGSVGWLLPKTPCGSRCSYAAESAVMASLSGGQVSGSFAISSWPPAHGPGPIALHEIARELTPPISYTDASGITHVFEGAAGQPRRRAAVEFPLMTPPARGVFAETFSTGSGAAVASHSVRLDTGSSHRPWFIALRAPTLDRLVAPMYAVGGPSGSEPIAKGPDESASRSTVDVYVDGLPVWTAEWARHVTSELSSQSAFAAAESEWSEAIGGGSASPVILYLGRLPANRTFRIDLVVRSEQRVTAPNCVQDAIYELDLVVHRCHQQRERLDVPARILVPKIGRAQVWPDFEIYSR